jgi:hypothetical protein
MDKIKKQGGELIYEKTFITIIMPHSLPLALGV